MLKQAATEGRKAKQVVLAVDKCATLSDPNNDARWQSVQTRDMRADGAFVYAVRSTGVYCRPTCPSRRPNRHNVAFFDSALEAESAGFRPCLRCRPKDANAQEQVVVRVQQLLDTVEPPPSLAELGTAVGLSPFHLQRLFKRVTGLTPREYASAQRAERLKQELKQGATVTDAMYNAGYGSTRALYESAPPLLGMHPRAYKEGGRGESIRYACDDTSLGPVLIAMTQRGVCALHFGEPAGLIEELRSEFPNATLLDDHQALAPYIDTVRDHLEGRSQRLDFPVDVSPTAFQQRVWIALREIPYGQTRTYTDVAQAIGEPAAVRAVARACAANPVALVVPCHRVVRKGGDISGYRWGVERKRTLLQQERLAVDAHEKSE